MIWWEILGNNMNKLYLVLFCFGAILLFPTTTFAQTTGTLQGFKIDANGQPFNNPGAAITVNGQTYGPGVNPYTVNLPAGNYDVSTSIPTGYIALFSLCTNCTEHPFSYYEPNSSVSITIPSGGFVDLYWKYIVIPDQTNSWQRGQILIQNSLNLYNGHILLDPGDPFPYKMWLFGWATTSCNTNIVGNHGCDAIFFARSTDSNHWEVYMGKDSSGQPKFDTTMNPSLWIPVVVAGNTSFDSWHIGDPSVIKINNTFYMAFTGYGFGPDGIPAWDAGDTDGGYGGIVGATSQDGINWQKSTTPLLAYAGDLGSKVRVGNGEYARPSLLYEDGKFKLWFDYVNGNLTSVSMGYAELATSASSNAFLTEKWVTIRADTNPALTPMANPSVVHVGNTYYAYGDPGGYGGAGWWWTARKITEAESSDGINWKFNGYVDPDSGCTATGVPQAYYENGVMYVTYGCQKGGNPYDTNYYQIRRMSKPLSSPVVIPGDLNGDGRIDIFDYNLLVSNFDKTGTGIKGDINTNGKVDIFDYNLLVGNFGK